MLLAIFSEAVISTDSLAMFISGSISKNIVIKGAISFLLIYILWCTGIALIHYFYKNQIDIKFEYNQKPSRSQITAGLLLLVITIIISYINWGGFKVTIELMNGIPNGKIGLGIAYFALQYLYYFLEAFLMVMILSFAQEAGVALWGNHNIPYGGIILAIIWGLLHIVFHGVVNGLTTTACAILYGYAFLAMNKNIKYAFPLVFLMFVL